MLIFQDSISPHTGPEAACCHLREMRALRQHCRSRAAEIMRRRLACFSAIVMGLYRRERTGKGSYVTTSLHRGRGLGRRRRERGRALRC